MCIGSVNSREQDEEGRQSFTAGQWAVGLCAASLTVPPAQNGKELMSARRDYPQSAPALPVAILTVRFTGGSGWFEATWGFQGHPGRAEVASGLVRDEPLRPFTWNCGVLDELWKNLRLGKCPLHREQGRAVTAWVAGLPSPMLDPHKDRQAKESGAAQGGGPAVSIEGRTDCVHSTREPGSCLGGGRCPRGAAPAGGCYPQGAATRRGLLPGGGRAAAFQKASYSSFHTSFHTGLRASRVSA